MKREKTRKFETKQRKEDVALSLFKASLFKDALFKAVRGHFGIKRCLHDAKACLAQGLPEKSCVKLGSPDMAQRWQFHDRECLLNAVSLNVRALECASEDLKGDREIVLNAVSQDWIALQWASEDLKGDREIVLNAVAQDWRALQWASEDLKGDREIVLNAVSQDGTALEWASEDLKGDREIVLNAMSQEGCRVLQWASEGLKGDREFQLNAVSQDGTALEWASEDLKGDREIVLNAVSSQCRALQWASEDLKGDREIVLNAVSQDWRALQWASSKGCEDQKVQELISGTDFERDGLLLKVSLFSGRSCTALWMRWNDLRSLLERCSAQLGLECQQVIDNGKLVHQCEATGIIGSWNDLQPGKMHFVTLALFLAARYLVICSLISAVPLWGR